MLFYRGEYFILLAVELSAYDTLSLTLQETHRTVLILV